ncbi:hypothetical protein, partial [Bradyrhizobium sp. CCBAU 45394]|uniref:hypothetical protein n=1 Tax=Bradyrhizobium sp. CCBAU 45394 TaxID=1325087 RepID=UPI00230313D5
RERNEAGGGAGLSPQKDHWTDRHVYSVGHSSRDGKHSRSDWSSRCRLAGRDVRDRLCGSPALTVEGAGIANTDLS